MRTLTLARMGRALMIAAAMIMLPQLASAQLPVESKSFKIQATTGSNAVTLTATTVSASYSLNLPAATGSVGSFLFYSGSNQLSWSSAAGGDNYVPRWESDLDGNGTADDPGIVWTSPTDANNPNWSRSGNEVGGILGTTAAGQAINFVTADAANIRMSIAADGAIGINNAATGGATTTIGRAAGHTTTIDGALDINGATTIDGATIGITGATTVVGVTNINATDGAATTIGTSGSGTVTVQGATLTTSGTLGHTGSLTLTGATSPLIVSNGSGGTTSGNAGDVLVSDGANTPEWQNLNQALGIRKAGKVAVTGSTVEVTGVTGLTADDAIIVTIEGTSGVVASVVRDVAGTSFDVNFSAEYTGTLNYMVIKVY